MSEAAPIGVQSGAASDRGLRRTMNEDSFLAQTPIFLIADGMGGHEAGEVASAAAIDAFAPFVGREHVAVDEARAAFAEAAARIQALPSATSAGAGTTLTGVMLTEHDGVPYWLTINIGDSRTYRLAGGVLEQISVDHSWVQELVEQGTLSETEAQHDPRRNVVTRAIGAGVTVQPDYGMIPAEVGDRILLCSDGLSGEVGPDVIAEVLLAEHDPQAAATRLVHEALLRGGHDNVTTVVVDVVGAPGADLDATMPRRDQAFASVSIDDDTVPLVRRSEHSSAVDEHKEQS